MKESIIFQIFKFTFNLITKALVYKKGSAALISLASSFGISALLKEVFSHAEKKEIVLPILVACLGIMIFFLFFIIDLVSGLVASKFESKGQKDWVKSDKLYKSIGKIGGVLLLIVLLLVLNLCALMIGKGWVYESTLYIMIFINFLTSAFEYHSIGENIKRRSGRKPDIFTFFDKLTDVVEKGIINRVSKLFGGDGLSDSSDSVNDDEMP